MKTGHAPDKVAFWSQHIQQWKSSGLLQKEYCATHGLGLKSFGRWKRILAKSRPARRRNPTRQPENLIPLSIVPDSKPDVRDASEGVLGNAGIRLHVNGNYAIDLAVGLTTILKALLMLYSMPSPKAFISSLGDRMGKLLSASFKTTLFTVQLSSPNPTSITFLSAP